MIAHVILSDDIRQIFGVIISYDKARRARETAFALTRETIEESYVLLHAYGEELKKKILELKIENHMHCFM